MVRVSAERQEHESTIIEQQDHIERLQDSCRELQEAAQALKEDGEQKYAASVAQTKQDRKQQVRLLCTSATSVTMNGMKTPSMPGLCTWAWSKTKLFTLSLAVCHQILHAVLPHQLT